MIDWQPIETAPKDGTQVLLWCVPAAGRHVLPIATGGRWYRGQWSHALSVARTIAPTHWAPLNPPEDA